MNLIADIKTNANSDISTRLEQEVRNVRQGSAHLRHHGRRLRVDG